MEDNKVAYQCSILKPSIVLLSMLSCQLFIAPSVAAENDETLRDYSVPRVTDDEDTKTLDNLVTDYVSDPLAITVCRGVYVKPWFDPVLLATGENSISADKGELKNTGTSTLTGNTVIEDGENRIYSDVLHLHKLNTGEYDKADAYGNVLIEQPDARITGYTAHLNMLTKNYQVKDSQFRLYDSHIRGDAELITQVQNKPYYIYDSTYTTCAPGSDFWSVNADKVVINKESGYGHAYNAVVYIEKVPVFYTPYMFFPIDKERKSGILSPSYKRSDSSGSEYYLPYYFNLAPNYDATLTGRFMSQRGLLADLEFRYMTINTEGTIHTSFIPEDSKFRDFKSFAKTNPYNYAVGDPRLVAIHDSNSNARGYISTQHKLKDLKNWSAELVYNYATDDNYFVDLEESPLFSDNRNLERSLRVSHSSLNSTTWLYVSDYQTLQPFSSSIVSPNFIVAPNIVNKLTFPFIYSDFSFEMTTDYINYRYDRYPENNYFLRTYGSRIDFAPTLKYDYILPFFQLTPKLTVHKTFYNLNLDSVDEALGKPDKPTRTVPMFSLRGQLFFEREFEWLDEKTVQSFEPEFLYVYSPYIDQNSLPIFSAGVRPLTVNDLFLENRFGGLDRLGDENRVSIGLNSRFFLEETAVQKASVSVGQMFFLRDRQLTVCNSRVDPRCIETEDPNYKRNKTSIYGSGYYDFDPEWRFNASANWDPVQKTIRSYQVGFTYNPDVDKVASVSLTSSKDTNFVNYSQIVSSIAWQVTPRWNILGQLYYNFADELLIHNFMGIEYENCCWAFRVGQQRYLLSNSGNNPEHETIMFFQFVLKGLYSYGDSHEDIAKKVIPGYIENTFATRY